MARVVIALLLTPTVVSCTRSNLLSFFDMEGQSFCVFDVGSSTDLLCYQRIPEKFRRIRYSDAGVPALVTVAPPLPTALANLGCTSCRRVSVKEYGWLMLVGAGFMTSLAELRRQHLTLRPHS